MLSMNSITKVYQAGVIETHALRSLSLEVEAGEFVAVTGPSGSGKTTFLNIAGVTALDRKHETRKLDSFFRGSI